MSLTGTTCLPATLDLEEDEDHNSKEVRYLQRLSASQVLQEEETFGLTAGTKKGRLIPIVS